MKTNICKTALIALALTMIACGKKATTATVQEPKPDQYVTAPQNEDSSQPEESIEEPQILDKISEEEKDLKAMPSQRNQKGKKCLSAPSYLSNRQDKYILEKPAPQQEHNTEAYNYIEENNYKNVKDEPLSTFSIDVDEASYTNCRRYLQNGSLPPTDAVRVEEFINYFDYQYAQPTDLSPFAVHSEYAPCPWNSSHKLLHIGIQGKNYNWNEIQPLNLVFLIDVSGSMEDANKLPLLKKSFKLLVNQLRSKDRVAIVVYAGAAGLVLPSTSNKEEMLSAIDQLSAGGSTAGGEGIKLAYKIAKENLIENGCNRVILATDGDFNVGQSSDAEMTRLLEEKRKDGIFLTTLGFGMGNYKDSKMESMADKGNGNNFYIDSFNEARKVLVSDLGSTLYTIAKDVKIQIEFNPTVVKSYRLVGYENRKLNNEDFNDDTKDAGELGAGHTVTAIYEIATVGSDETNNNPKIDPLKYQTNQVKTGNEGELATIKLRYKAPKEETSQLITKVIRNRPSDSNKVSQNFNFSAAVASFGMLLRDSKHKGNASFDQVISLAQTSKGEDTEGYRSEFIKLVKTAQELRN